MNMGQLLPRSWAPIVSWLALLVVLESESSVVLMEMALDYTVSFHPPRHSPSLLLASSRRARQCQQLFLSKTPLRRVKSSRCLQDSNPDFFGVHTGGIGMGRSGPRRG